MSSSIWTTCRFGLRGIGDLNELDLQVRVVRCVDLVSKEARMFDEEGAHVGRQLQLQLQSKISLQMCGNAESVV